MALWVFTLIALFVPSAAKGPLPTLPVSATSKTNRAGMEELGCEGGVSPPLFFADDEEGGPASDEDEVSNASQLHEPAQLDAAATRPPLDGQWHAGGASSNAVAQPGRQMNRGILRAAVPVDYNTVFTNAKAGMDDVDKETTIDVRDARQLRCIFALAGSTPGRRVSRMFECKGQTKTTAFSRA